MVSSDSIDRYAHSGRMGPIIRSHTLSLRNIEHGMDRDNEKHLLEKKIKKIDEQITFLTNLRHKCQQELDSFNAPASIPPVSYSSTDELSPEEKATLFMSYFRGRDDVYAHKRFCGLTDL
jgi:hypothetical protein